MAKTLWTLPVPSTALLEGCAFEELPKRACALLCENENDSGTITKLRLLFDGVEAFKCTYFLTIGAEMIEKAYDKVVDLGSSHWLSAIKERLDVNLTQDIAELRHLVIFLGWTVL